jgi:hypothetical protein
MFVFGRAVLISVLLPHRVVTDPEGTFGVIEGFPRRGRPVLPLPF